MSTMAPKFRASTSGKSALAASLLLWMCCLCNIAAAAPEAGWWCNPAERYYEGLFVICPLELKREFDQLDLTEGERNECDWNSPSRKAYGRSE